MIEQKGIIHPAVLLGIIIILSLAALIYSHGGKDNLSIEPPKLFTFSAYLNTIDGKKLFYSDSFGGVEQKDQDEQLSKVRSRLADKNNFLQDAIISLQEKEVYFYDKHIKKLQIIDLPSEVKKFEKGSLQLFAQELNDKKYLVNLSHNQKEHFTYIFNKEDSSLVHFKQFDEECNYIYCNGPAILKKLSDIDFIFEQGAGDACWSAGVIHSFNLKTNTAKKLLEYSNGCSSEFDSYFGMFENSFIRAKHDVLNSYTNGGVGPDQQITEIYSTDIDGVNTVLISRDKMPKGISYVKLNPENNMLYLNNNSSFYYQFNLKTYQLEAISQDQIVESKTPNKNADKGMENIKDFLTFQVIKKDLEGIEKVYTGGQYMGIRDDSGVSFTVMEGSFLNQIKFDQEEKERCLYQRSPSLNDKQYPFRFAGHEFEDSASALNKYEIKFVVISKCIEYLTEKGKRNEWVLGAKRFILNIKTGKMRLDGELKN